MPILDASDYKPSIWFRSGHINTIYPSFYRNVELPVQRETLELADGDFIDLDWTRKPGNGKLLIVLHGLEGNGQRHYVQGMIRTLQEHDWDGIGLNFRGCSGRPNRMARNYHSGDTGDLDELINYIESEFNYKRLAIVGFSLGGNVTLKYVGEKGESLNPKITHAVGISVPVDLAGCSAQLNKWYNTPYMRSFMQSLKEKINFKSELVRDQLDLEQVAKAKNFDDFDEWVTAPLHGFSSAAEYWEKSSSLPYLDKAKIPTLLINALDDSFLSPSCYPTEMAINARLFHLMMPKYGGHVGFVNKRGEKINWSEQKVLDFLESNYPSSK